MAEPRHIIWEWLAAPGLEHVRVEEAGDKIRATSHVVFADDGVPCRVRYRMTCTQGWEFCAIDVELDRLDERRRLSLRRVQDVVWLADGRARSDLADCVDIDIEASPLTNTLPIRRLTFLPDQAIEIDVAYIKIPSLDVVVARQEYVRLDAADPPRRFRYRGLASGFTADLTIDALGFVEEYPNLWRRAQ